MLLRSSEMECCNILMKYRITCLWNPQDSCSQPLFAPGLAWVGSACDPLATGKAGNALCKTETSVVSTAMDCQSEQHST